MSKGYGFLWLHDKLDEKHLTTIQNGYNRYFQKYGVYPDLIECSIKDAQQEFLFEGITVTPSKHWTQGMVFYMHGDGIKI